MVFVIFGLTEQKLRALMENEFPVMKLDTVFLPYVIPCDAVVSKSEKKQDFRALSIIPSAARTLFDLGNLDVQESQGHSVRSWSLLCSRMGVGRRGREGT